MSVTVLSAALTVKREPQRKHESFCQTKPFFPVVIWLLNKKRVARPRWSSQLHHDATSRNAVSADRRVSLNAVLLHRKLFGTKLALSTVSSHYYFLILNFSNRTFFDEGSQNTRDFESCFFCFAFLLSVRFEKLVRVFLFFFRKAERPSAGKRIRHWAFEHFVFRKEQKKPFQ